MKKKTRKYEEDFFVHANKVMGDKRFKKGIKKGKQLADEIRLKEARTKLGLTQSELNGMVQTEVSKIENRKDLKISTLIKYARAMGKKLKITLVDEDDETKKSIVIFG